MKKILISIFASLIVLIGGVVFISKNFDTNKVPERDFIVIKGYGKELYSSEYPFAKGTQYIDIIKIMSGSTQQPIKIYSRSGHSWKEVKPHAKAYYDTTVKADF